MVAAVWAKKLDDAFVFVNDASCLIKVADPNFACFDDPFAWDEFAQKEL